MSDFDIYSVKQRWKFYLFLASVIIGTGSLFYTGKLVDQLSAEERKKVEIWAEATRLIADASQEQQDLNFLLKVIETNTTIPVILTDQDSNIIFHRNLNPAKAKKEKYLVNKLEEMKLSNSVIEIKLEGKQRNYLYYEESIILKRLSIYPYVQLSVIIVFIFVSYLAFSASRKAEQNKVWVGLSRETAHQLGTPTSSLIAWVELLREKNVDPAIIDELDKDVQRLGMITERFSNIGSQPVLISVDLNELIENVIQYMKSRIPSTVSLRFKKIDTMVVPVNTNLFSWVFENLIKNALDAISNKGIIEVIITSEKNKIHIDIKDNGKGIPRADFRNVFKPGFTTKSRGWGLGLSLVRRIVEQYHNGKILVLQSEVGKGTTFRISLNVKKSSDKN